VTEILDKLLHAATVLGFAEYGKYRLVLLIVHVLEWPPFLDGRVRIEGGIASLWAKEQVGPIRLDPLREQR